MVYCWLYKIVATHLFLASYLFTYLHFYLFIWLFINLFVNQQNPKEVYCHRQLIRLAIAIV